MRQKSFFAQLLKNFMLTLFVPIAAVLLIYFYAEHSIQTQIIESSQKSLNQFFSAIDTTVEDMRDTCMAMLNNDQCELYVSYSLLKPEKAATTQKASPSRYCRTAFHSCRRCRRPPSTPRSKPRH